MGCHQFLQLLLGYMYLLTPVQGKGWTMTIYTGDVYAGGTDSNVWLGLNGVYGSETKKVDKDMAAMDRGSADALKYDLYIGDIHSISIDKDGSGVFEEWYLTKIVMYDSTTGVDYTFQCNCWINWWTETKWVYTDKPVCYDVDNCVTGHKQCGWSSFSEALCTHCHEPHYSGGWYGGCVLCNDIANCKSRYCTNAWDQKCRLCSWQYIYYKPSYSGATCDRLCNWDQPCWPGSCQDGYSAYCQCVQGFSHVGSTCQPDTLPVIETCHLEAEGPNGEKKRSGSTGPTTQCIYETEFYGNFVPVKLHFDMMAGLYIDTSLFPYKPHFISSYGFGITDASIEALSWPMAGAIETVASADLLVDTSQSYSATQTFSNAGTMNIPPLSLSDGQSLCGDYNAFGGGWLITVDENGHISAPNPYYKTQSKRTICYRFDATTPQHCLETGSCTSDPLILERRISKAPKISVDFQGWFDPIPDGGIDVHASDIESYHITVNEVSVSNTMLKVGFSAVFTKSVSMDEHRMTLNIPPGTPKLFCVTLEVKDHADNVKHARRFYLYDESSFITSRPDKQFYATSAIEESDYHWHLPNEDICLDWKDYFYNQFYMDNNLLLPVEPDPNGFVNGIYEQTSGTLPVSGTPNVNGIIEFMFSYSKNNATFSSETEVSNFLDQTLCTTLDLNDGDTYILKIRAIDIASNTYSEERIVYIDGSVPHVDNIGLEKDGYRQLYVHDQTDLSKMDLQFDAYDPHSGIKTVEWFFGITDYNDVVDSGAIGVNTLLHTNCSGTEDCYCPAIGECEILKYSIPLYGLVTKHQHIGNHNRNYFFTIKVTNNAELISTEYMDILVDDSPPETGVILEGPDGYSDIDYTDDEMFYVNWHGFIDHESGIRLYRVGLADRCLSKEEVYQMNDSVSEAIFAEANDPDNVVQLPANFTGKRYVTGIAINNAMDPSDPVCSDGISKDLSPTEFRNIIIDNARWSESLYCFENKTWFLRSDLIRVKLADVHSCNSACNFETSWPFIEAIPVISADEGITESVVNRNVTHTELLSERNSTLISDFLCSEFSVYDSNSLIYLPNDHINMHWDISDEFSQIEDFFVGFGESDSEAIAPGLVNYQSTDKRFFFTVNHIAVGTDKEFFIFLKAVNKAGLETIMTIGPVLVDQTPPKFTYIPEVHVDGDNVVVGWENDTFFDEEQTAEIHQISFQIGHDNTAISPFLDWRKDTAKPCDRFTGGCFKYPLSTLQKQDTDIGLVFYMKMQVYNIAGHFLSVTTPEFTLPAMYPPAHAIITDLDPSEDTNQDVGNGDNTDIDAHFSTNTVCAAWKGFDHHEDIKLEFGLGSSSGLDDIYNFRNINSTQSYCLISTNILDNVKIYVSVRATSSAGSTIASSDGVIIYNTQHVLDKLEVFDGPECFSKKNLLSKISNISTESFWFDHTLIIGKIYTLRLLDPNSISQSLDIYLVQTMSDNDHRDLIFQPYVEYPTFILTDPGKEPVTAEIYDCEENIPVALGRHSIMAHWNDLSDHFTYEAALITLGCANALDSSCFDYQTPFSAVKEHAWIKHQFNLHTESTYHTGVRPCLNSACADVKLSSGVKVESDVFTVNILESKSAKGDSGCTSISLEWTQINTVNVSFYQWSVATSIGRADGISILVQWRTVTSTDGNGILKVNDCVSLPGYAFKQLFACVRAFSRAGQKSQSCKELNVESDQNAFKSAVYEFDVTFVSWTDIKKVIRSRYIGDALRDLHEADLDFGTEYSKVVGAVLSGNNRNITWYLTNSNTIPETCDDSPNCERLPTTTEGYVEVPQEKILHNKIQFICADAPEEVKEQDSFTETLPAIQLCSNGFVIDDVPPSGGELQVESVNGYINDLQSFAVTWKNFDDNIDVTALGYKNRINSYAVQIGSSPERRDIRQYTDIGDSTSLLVEDLQLNSGTSLFISVIATDHAGLHTRVSSEKLVVDITPPSVGEVVTMSKWISDFVLEIQLLNWSDHESGIDKYITFVGSSRYTMDILSESEHTGETMVFDLHGTPILDGHLYYLSVKAMNRAGLYSEYAVIQFGVDHSPPTGGHVIDGLVTNSDIDIDFQTSLDYISGHWKGFIDPHSGISYYTVGLGTDPFAYDVEPKISVGLRTDIIWNSSFTTGGRFFITVEACNAASLCHAVSSDGIVLDDSPPIPGLVRVGSSSQHHAYIPRSSSLEIFWTGFEDPQSGLDHYEACIGTRPDTCDVAPVFNCLLSSSYIKTGLNMPLNTNLYITVTGYNKVNLTVSKTSNYFAVDSTPPKVLINPKFVSNSSNPESTLVQSEKSTINLIWKFSDSESPITRHIVTLATHHEGHTPLEHVEFGQIDQLTIDLDGKNWLHNGDTYKAIVTACNAAGLCTTAESDDLLIDSTPPHMGGFETPLTWRSFLNEDNQIASEVNLTWHGFYDHESGIKRFYVGLGSTFTGNEFSNGLVEIETNGTTNEYSKPFIVRDILSDDGVVVSIVAENNAGLMSSFARVTLLALYLTPPVPTESAYGIFEIEKHSCDIHFCNKDCTCAVVGKGCTEVETNMTCNDVSALSDNAFSVSVTVYSGLEDNPQHITASSACISAHWTVEEGQSRIKRFEWTPGIKDEPYGEGIFDLVSENPWMDVGLFQYGIFCLPINRSLVHDTEYIIYVKTWITMESYQVFQSPPVLIDQTPPAIRKGEVLKDSDDKCDSDYDIIDWTDRMSACWTGVFYEAQGNIVHYIVGLGTSPGSDNIVHQRNVGLNTTLDVLELTLSAGHQYYFTVIAYNNVGLHTTVSSDGFIVDIDRPIGGVVYNTYKYRNYPFHPSTDTFELSWNGFLDHDSGIQSYYAAILEDSESKAFAVNFTHVSLQTSLTLTDLNLEHGKRYFGAVKGLDAVGHESNVIHSQSKLVDATAPTAYKCENTVLIYEMQNNKEQNALIEFPITVEPNFMYTVTGSVTQNSHYPTIRFTVKQNIARAMPLTSTHDGHLLFRYSFYPSFQGSFNATFESDSTSSYIRDMHVTKCEVSVVDDDSDALVVRQISEESFTALIKAIDPESAIKRTYLGIGTTPSGFQLNSLYPVDVNTDETFAISASHGTPIYATAIVENFAGLRSVFRSKKVVNDHTPPVIQDILVEKDEVKDYHILNTSDVAADEMMLRLRVSWDASDEESGIKACFVSVGALLYSDDIQKTTLASNGQQFQSAEFKAKHGDNLYVSVKCVNNIELATVKSTEPIVISILAPSKDEANLDFVPSSIFTISESEHAAQPNLSYVQFSWRDFKDISGISSYQYRLFSKANNLIDWRDAGSKDFVSLQALNLVDSESYIAEVRAVNPGHLESERLNSTINIEGKGPQVTGQPIAATTNGRTVTLDWTNVFTTNPEVPILYDLAVGSAQGFVDIADEHSLTTSSHSFHVPKDTVLTQNINELFISVTSVYSTGLETVYSTTYKLFF